MQKLSSLTVAQLQRAVMIKRQIESLQQELDSLTGDSDAPTAGRRGISRRLAVALESKKIVQQSDQTLKRKKHKMSAAGRAAISAASKARWAKIKTEKT